MAAYGEVLMATVSHQRDHHLALRPASCVRVHNISRTAPPMKNRLQHQSSFGVRDAHLHSCRRVHAEPARAS